VYSTVLRTSSVGWSWNVTQGPAEHMLAASPARPVRRSYVSGAVRNGMMSGRRLRIGGHDLVIKSFDEALLNFLDMP
jgi:hypothetical protein